MEQIKQQIKQLDAMLEALEDVNAEVEQFISSNGYQTNSPLERDLADVARLARQELASARASIERARSGVRALLPEGAGQEAGKAPGTGG